MTTGALHMFCTLCGSALSTPLDASQENRARLPAAMGGAGRGVDGGEERELLWLAAEVDDLGAEMSEERGSRKRRELLQPQLCEVVE